jgi:hypothetical protein
MPTTAIYDIAFNSGLTYTNVGGAGSDFTVTYI